MRFNSTISVCNFIFFSSVLSTRHTINSFTSRKYYFVLKKKKKKNMKYVFTIIIQRHFFSSSFIDDEMNAQFSLFFEPGFVMCFHRVCYLLFIIIIITALHTNINPQTLCEGMKENSISHDYFTTIELHFHSRSLPLSNAKCIQKSYFFSSSKLEV